MTSLNTVVSSSPPNFGMGDTHSWVQVSGADRLLYARAVYMTNASDMSVSLSANDLNINVEDIENLITTSNSLLNSQLGQSGFIFVQPGDGVVSGNFSTFKVVSACKIASIAATNSTTTGLTDYELPVNFSFSGPITEISLTYGAALVYKL